MTSEKRETGAVKPAITSEMIKAGVADTVEVTTGMIAAGVEALYAYDNDPMFSSPEERVDRIFRAMIAAKLTVVGKRLDQPLQTEP